MASLSHARADKHTTRSSRRELTTVNGDKLYFANPKGSKRPQQETGFQGLIFLWPAEFHVRQFVCPTTEEFLGNRNQCGHCFWTNPSQSSFGSVQIAKNHVFLRSVETVFVHNYRESVVTYFGETRIPNSIPATCVQKREIAYFDARKKK